jgi:hypothetical protein
MHEYGKIPYRSEKNMLEELLKNDKAPWKKWDRQVPNPLKAI